MKPAISPVPIADKPVGPGCPCYVIAEAGVNHNGDMDLAHQLIDAAVDASADSIKFQAFVSEQLVAANAPKARYQIETTGQDGDQFTMLKALELSGEQHQSLKSHCDEAGITYLCTPYDEGSIDMLERLDVPAYKIASTDTTNDPFLRYLASKGRPAILSTGMSDLSEVGAAVDALEAVGDRIVILHCTSEYPAPVDEANLKVIATMEAAFGCPVGYSDHTPGIAMAPWAVVAGACMLEKHFTIDRSLPGPDHPASVEPKELAELVQTVRRAEASLGDGIKRPTAGETANKAVMRKSLVARRDIAEGAVIAAEDLICKRPGHGLAPGWFDRVVGRRALRDLPRESVIGKDAIDWPGEG